MPKVSDEYREERRREIVDAALRVFRRKGFQFASMADIIAESGLSAGAIYGHYASKAELIEAVAASVVTGRTDALAELRTQPDRPSPAAAVRVFLDGVLERIVDPAILVQMWGEAATNPVLFGFVHGVVDRLIHAFVDYIELWQREVNGVDAEQARRIATAQAPLYVSCCQGFILQSAFVEDFDAEGYFAAAEEYLPSN